ncbi:putative GTP binding protein (Bud4) [Aspergillus affinis]|uniref:putative GTP binding protein (Bud4) n=1 Tax=Aspergillus affinis TaxID=1070780 RepID=UPI0022FEB2A9|nr:Bud site selection protein bud4 [Aspergillus affinis]KAI9035118.1 Bud site selection protein bud4 [Aspergillus affinis]
MKATRNIESSPYDAPASPRLFWQGRESGSPFQRSSENQAPYDPESSFTPSKRPSLENLKRQSRVKNSHMFRDHNQEYDPAQVYVPQRPLSTTKSPQKQSQGDYDPDAAQQIGPRPPSPSKDQVPPAKSSLSRASRFGVKDMGFDPENEIWSDFDNRYQKSVTFDAAPPQVNEYEMTTPDPSSIASGSRDGSYDSEEDEADISFDRESSMDRDDSFDASLEDLEKTPVVLPEDWRYMSPANANEDLVKEDEDPFTEDESESGDVRPSSRQELPATHARVESMDSNEERRPLPPLPAAGRTSFSPRPPSPGKLAAAFERGSGSGSQRGLPPPPGPATYSKSDITDLSHPSMSLEDRLRLMMIQENERKDHDEEQQPQNEDDDERHSNVVEPQAEHIERKDNEKTENQHNHEPAADAPGRYSPPHISRDSILRDLRKSESFMDDSFETSSQIESDNEQYMHYDPDVAIPSLENDNDFDDDDDDTNSVIVKQEEPDNDLYDIPDYYENVPSKDSSFKSLQDKHVLDDESKYSSQTPEDFTQSRGSQSDGQSTPVPGDRNEQIEDKTTSPEDHDLTPNEVDLAPKMAALRESLQRPRTPEDHHDQVSEPSTPDSVIRHPMNSDESDRDVSPADEAIPDPVATIKAHGAGLKTRPSLTPADVESMAATRRQVSGQHIPPMPHQTHTQQQEPDSAENNAPSDGLLAAPQAPKEAAQRQSSLMQLDIPFSIQEESLGFGLDKEFDRVIETQKVAFELSLSQLYSRATRFPQAQQPHVPFADPRPHKQRGYLMRQNTKVIIASSRPEEEPAPAPAEGPSDPRAARSPAPSPRKASQQTWTTVPWNGQPRRSSIRTSSSAIRKKPVSGPVPPLPGQQSNVQETPATIEESEPALNGALEDGEERGRLFVKVVGLKYLDLPVPRGERSYFSLTLDNGLHCVTTAWLELGKSAPIGQEFELIVQNDLEFQLTLQMKVDDERFRTPEPAPTASPTRQKASTFSRVFASPRKRKELEMKQQLASQQQKGKDVNAGVWDRLRSLIARDGSFARAYVALSDHEKYAFGRPYTVDIACFNEWAVEEQPSSIKSKKSTASSASQRRPPYKIGKLELQLLFVPRPKGTKDDDMPKSMNACIREMRDAESVSARSYDGFLSQQGGDCPYWRRRFFKLQGSKLTAFHETTRQPRATINLSKAAKLIDDRSSLTQKETTTRGGGRRKSAFAEEEEGYMFVEEGFRIRFGNGEVIDFYADSAAEKDGWMKVLADAVGKGSGGSSQTKPWTDFVLKHERSVKARREPEPSTPTSTLAGPPPPRKDAPPPPPSSASRVPGPPASSRPRHRHTQSQPDVRSADARRNKARSLMF